MTVSMDLSRAHQFFWHLGLSQGKANVDAWHFLAEVGNLTKLGLLLGLPRFFAF